jgi:hypothetical protein
VRDKSAPTDVQTILLNSIIDEAHSANFKDYCLTATVDELQTTSASMMEKFATQLHMQGVFDVPHNRTIQYNKPT